jgi:hypothetical protein
MKNLPKSYEILLSEGPRKSYQEIREELNEKQKIMKDADDRIILNRKENLKKNIEEVQEIKKIYTYGHRQNVNFFIIIFKNKHLKNNFQLG